MSEPVTRPMQRSAFIDINKLVASQGIVLHHRLLYSPMAEWLTLAWPRRVAVLADRGSLAIQPSRVIGDFLAAQPALSLKVGPLAVLLRQR